MQSADASSNGGLNPTLRRLLRQCGMERTFVRGDGMWLTDDTGRRYLDFYAQYGAVALGHNAPAVVGTLRAALDEHEPAMVQPYRARHAEALAARLGERTGLTRCIFTTSGAETVEAAIKLARARTRRSTIVSATGSYHGKTMGALAATGQRQHAIGFGPEPAGFERVPFGDSTALRDRLARGDVAALLLEPIQGESGVQVAPPGYLATARALCTQHGVALVLDEIQTGLGRTGRLLASEHDGVVGDIVLLAKALGGGVLPLGACLSSEAFWDEGFALRHSSTFANNNFACRVGLVVLDELDAGGLCERAEQRGALLAERLAWLAARHPRVIAAVRGRGLLRAVELRPLDDDAGSFLSYFDRQGLLPYVLAASLAERAGVLVLPSLGSAHTLRLAPPLVVSEDEIHRAVDALDEACLLLGRRDAVTFARAIGATSSSHRIASSEPVCLPSPPRIAKQPHTFAFIIHYTSLDDIVTTDPSFARLDPDELGNYAAFAAAMPAGVVLGKRVCSRTGAVADGFIIALPLLPAHMARIGRHQMRDAIVHAVDLAASLGANVVGLGGYTTAYAQRGRAVVGRGPAITTGNTLTAAMAIEALREAAGSRGRTLGGSRIAVVGARGSVGALCARLVAAEQPAHVVLIGNPASPTRHLDALAEELGPIASVSTSLDSLQGCDHIVAATGAALPALRGAQLHAGTIVCDVARPYDTPPELRARHDITVLDGGLVALPDPALRFGIGNLQGYPDGVQLACLSETIVLALAGATGDHGIGDDIPAADATRMLALAAEHGFVLAAPQRARQQVAS